MFYSFGEFIPIVCRTDLGYKIAQWPWGYCRRERLIGTVDNSEYLRYHSKCIDPMEDEELRVTYFHFQRFDDETETYQKLILSTSVLTLKKLIFVSDEDVSANNWNTFVPWTISLVVECTAGLKFLQRDATLSTISNRVKTKMKQERGFCDWKSSPL